MGCCNNGFGGGGCLWIIICGNGWSGNGCGNGCGCNNGCGGCC